MFRIYVEIIEDLFYVTCDSYVVSPTVRNGILSQIKISVIEARITCIL
jgi:hypothetical protein